ncbi:hypothetical protein [Yoonia vestfoldensis]|uniref:hypothetical protein n=1 Tax=Yoonia vestfoldensis TaxID=245188 RepID=UPI00036474E1|nr:hypothetical protein [Yoonia vestfoldensis]
MFRAKILPTLGALIALFVVIGIFPRQVLDSLGASDAVKGIVVIVVAIGVAWVVERLLKPKT